MFRSADTDGFWNTSSVKSVLAGAPTPLDTRTVIGYAPPVPRSGSPEIVAVSSSKERPLGRSPSIVQVKLRGAPVAVNCTS